MKVMKFGGTSVGTPQRMKDVSKLITATGEPTFVVLSAMSGTTNTLVEISDYLYKKNPEGANNTINKLERKYLQHVEDLYEKDDVKEKMRAFISDEFRYLRTLTKTHFTTFEEKIILAQGEIISTNMVTAYLQEQGVKTLLISALDFMRTDKNAEPDTAYIREHLTGIMAENQGYDIYLTQGFICRNAYNEVDNLLRGGSDYTACLIGAVLDMEEIQIWT
ncbi:MAG: aspartate kinase, partial [Bacteroidaceae bacterium]|nr:aspartate kinase [Bacteroidaceae bacterium]